MNRVPRIGVGGPVGSGKTTLVERLVPMLMQRDRHPVVITNDIFTREDAEHVKRTLEGCIRHQPHSRGRHGSLPSHGGTGRPQPQPACRRGADRSISRLRYRPDRKRRRQPDPHLQPCPGGLPDLRDRRGRRRQDPPQARAGHHPNRPAGGEQDRPGSIRGRGPERDAPGPQRGSG